MKFSQYNIDIEMDYGLLIYNTNTEEVAKIKKADLVVRYKNLLESKKLSLEDDLTKFLYDKGFIVDYDLDEFEEAKKNHYAKLEKEDDIANIMIHTTDNCNFRCVYCFKEAFPKDLSDESWENLYQYIKKSLEHNLFKAVILAFYGGEPMLKYSKIIEFMKKVNALNAKYPNVKIFYRMVTNCYLLTKEKYEELTSLGLNLFQITLDGFEDSHNKMRPLANGGGTWSKIVENLRAIDSIDDNVTINLRTNFNETNKQEIDEFNVWLKKEFKNKKFVFVKSPVSKYTDSVKDDLIMDPEDEVALQQQKENIKRKPLYGLTYHSNLCKYTRKNHFALSTSGKISHCEEFDDEGTVIGELKAGGVIEYTIPYEEWCTRLETEECKTCVLYPACLARSCSKAQKCDIVFQNYEKALDAIKEQERFL